MKQIYTPALILVASLVGVSTTLGVGVSTIPLASTGFVASLYGGQEIPPVDTNATGQATFQPEPQGTIQFRVTVENLEDAVAAHIHCAPAGMNGPVGLTLFSGEPTTIVNGILAEATRESPGV